MRWVGGANGASLRPVLAEPITTPVTTRGRVPLGVLTLVKLLLGVALRLPYLFLGTVTRNLGISVADGGRILGVGELAGLASIGIGPSLDRGRHRRWLLTGMAIGILGCFGVAAVHTSAGLLVGFGAICMGMGLIATAGHSFLGTEVPYAQRSRAIGLFETSWAGALLLGAPVAAVVMRFVGWWSPWLLVGVMLAAVMPATAARMPGHASSSTRAVASDTIFAWRAVISTVVGSNLMVVGAIVMFATFGPWLQDQHHVKDVGLGAVAVGLGFMELISTSGSAAVADRIGKRRAVLLGMLVMTVAAVLLLVVGNRSLIAAVVGIVGLFGGFEFAYVSLLAVTSEVGGARRATVVSVEHSLSTVMRAAGAAVGTWLYGRSGLHPVLAVTIVCALGSAVVVLASGAERFR